MYWFRQKMPVRIPDQGDFAADTEIELNTSGNHYRLDTTGAGLGRFSEAPNGNVLYCNGVECLAWAGEEMRVGGFYTATTATESLDEVGFGSHAEWDVTGQFLDSNGYAEITYDAPDITGTLQQENIDLAAAVTSSAWFYFSYTCTVTTPIAGGSITLVLNGGDTYIPATNVTLPQTAGRHTVTFYTDDSAATGNFKITATEMGEVSAGEIRLDDFTLQPLLKNPFSATEAVNNTLSSSGNTVTIEPDTRGSWVVLSTRKLQGVYYDVSSANAVASLLTCEYWKNDGTWAAVSNPVDGTSASSKSLAQDGWFMFDYTSDASPFHFESNYLYAYKFHLGDADGTSAATIKYVSLNAPMQPIVDLWDGVPRQPIVFKIWRNGVSKFKDFTLDVNEASYESVPLVAQMDGMTSSDYIIVMADDRLTGIHFAFLAGFVNETAARTADVLYWNGSAYTAVTGTETDGTILGTSTMGQDGLLWWVPPAESSEVVKTEFGVTGYSYKIAFNDTLSGVIGVEPDQEEDIIADDGDIALDVVTVYPAQKTIKPFKFPSQFKNRSLLCGYTQGKEGNRCDYAIENTTEGWNGSDSSDDGGL
jgi:hypothetical protein